jgi:hypothetical protein
VVVELWKFADGRSKNPAQMSTDADKKGERDK